MPAITNIEQVKELRLSIIHKCNQPSSLNVLLLGDGFANEEIYDDFIEDLILMFFKIPPFKYCKNYINILTCFTESKSSVIQTYQEWDGAKTYHENDRVKYNNTPYFSTINDNILAPPSAGWEIEDEWYTVFRLYKEKPNINGYCRLKTWEKNRLYEVISNIPITIKLNSDFPEAKNASEIWFNPFSKSFGAVGIFANSSMGVGESIYEELPKLFRCFISDITGHTLAPSGTNLLFGGYQHRLAHELSHSFSLGDEYIRTNLPIISQNEGDKLINSRYTNIQAIYSDNDITETNIEELKNNIRWKSLMRASERNKISDSSGIFTKSKLSEFGSQNIIYDKESLGFNIHWSDIFLVEGAIFSEKVYRSNFECRMRKSYYYEDHTNNVNKYKEIVNGVAEYGSPEFCRVCNYNLKNKITGYTEFSSGLISRKKLHFLFYKQVVPRIKKAFSIQNKNFEKKYSTAGPWCQYASIMAFIIFKNISSSFNMKFLITAKHVSLYYNGVICDPTYYDLYRLGSFQPPGENPFEDSDLSYDSIIGEEGVFKNWEITGGKVGTISEMMAYILRFTMKNGSFTHSMPLPVLTGNAIENQIAINIFLNDIVTLIYGENVYTWKENQKNETGTVIDPYLTEMQQLWDKWLEYKNFKRENKNLPGDKSMDHLVPLDMDKPLKYVLKL